MSRRTPQVLAQAVIASSERLEERRRIHDQQATPEAATASLFLLIPRLARHALLGHALKTACEREPDIVSPELRYELISAEDYALAVLGEPFDAGFTENT